jgi:hypothetical protein
LAGAGNPAGVDGCGINKLSSRHASDFGARDVEMGFSGLQSALCRPIIGHG